MSVTTTGTLRCSSSAGLVRVIVVRAAVTVDSCAAGGSLGGRVVVVLLLRVISIGNHSSLR